MLFRSLRKINKKEIKEEIEKEEVENKSCPYCLSSIPKKATKCAYCTSDIEGENI